MLLVPLCFAAAIAAGAAWGAIPGVLKARFGSHEVINTIMMNFIAVALASYFTQYHYRTPGDPIMQTAPISASAHICRGSGRFIPGLPERIPLNVAFLLALVACALVYVFLWRTKWGYEMRATGSNPAAAEYGGISVRRQIVLAMAISGGLAGMVGINEVLGYRYRYYDGFSDNYGFTGIAVALLGRNHPVGVIFAALLFAVLQRGGVPSTRSPSTSRRTSCRCCRRRSFCSSPPRRFSASTLARSAGTMADLFTIALIFSTIRLATPLILAALGGLFSERSGVINIALEGHDAGRRVHRRGGDLCYAAVPGSGSSAAIGAGVLIALIHAVACIRYKADQVVAARRSTS